jgi:predicted flap endonuclease-1-like 5' DNA nuclease
MPYPVNEIHGIGPDDLASLKAAGIRTTDKLLASARTPKQRLTLASKAGVDKKKILLWANAADRMRIKGIGADYAELLRAVGVDTIRELKYRNPAKLAEALAAMNAKRKLVRLLPSEKTVRRWIESANKLPLMISYR